MVAPDISVIVPMFDVAGYLPAALASLAAQTADPDRFEVVIVDDASADDSLALARRFAATARCDVQIVALAHRRGPGHARNRGIERARGRTIALLDADDELEPTAVATAREFLAAHPHVRYAYSRCTHIGGAGRRLARKPGVPSFSRAQLLHYNFVGHLKCFDRDLHREIGGYDEQSAAEDYDHILRASERLVDEQVAQIPRYLYRYRLHGQNHSFTGAEAVCQAAAAAIRASLARAGTAVGTVAYRGRTDHAGGGYAYYAHLPGQ